GGVDDVFTIAASPDATSIALSPVLDIAPDLEELDLSVDPGGDFDGVVTLHWTTVETQFGTSALKTHKAGDHLLHRLGGAHPPLGANTFQLRAEPGEAGVLPDWKQIEMRGRYARIPTLQVFYNH